MPGPDPKPNRVRRNTPVKEQVRAVLPREGRKGRPPGMPPWVPVDDWAEEMWRRWWTSPQATQWDAKLHPAILGRLLLLYAENPESSEIRQIEQQLGLTPKAMRDLGWRVADEEPEQRKQTARSERPHLRAVDPESA